MKYDAVVGVPKPRLLYSSGPLDGGLKSSDVVMMAKKGKLANGSKP